MATLDPFTCVEVFNKLDSYLDRELAPVEVAMVRAHLEVCTVCAAEARFEASFLDEMRAKVRRIALPADFSDHILRALRAAQDETRS